MAKDKKKEVGFESVKHRKDVVERVREHKKDTGVQIGIFFDKAAEKELDRLKYQEKK